MSTYPFDHRHFLPGITAEEWETMVGCMTPVLLAAGRALYEPDGDDRLLADRALLFVRGGRLSLRPIEADMEISIIPPAVVGRAAFFTGDLIFTRDFVVQEELDALVLTHQSFERLAADHPRLALSLAMDTAAELALTVGGTIPALQQRGILLPPGEGRP